MVEVPRATYISYAKPLKIVQFLHIHGVSFCYCLHYVPYFFYVFTRKLTFIHAPCFHFQSFPTYFRSFYYYLGCRGCGKSPRCLRPADWVLHSQLFHLLWTANYTYHRPFHRRLCTSTDTSPTPLHHITAVPNMKSCWKKNSLTIRPIVIAKVGYFLASSASIL